ncbi:MAG: DUF885 domain-containing protein [Candidatus Eremiobacteraeota bacterium]|nr:DUF885 domain-containing protein [Candidatus Eremiobacteraeota bacterium]
MIARTLFAAPALALLLAAATPAPSDYDAKLQALDRRYTEWSLSTSPTSATDAGIHKYDTRLSDFSPQEQAAEMTQLRAFRDELAQLKPAEDAGRHDVVDYLLVRSDIEGDWWGRTVLKGLSRNPSVYEGECSNGIFSLVKKPFASDEVRVRDAIARLKACPGVLEQGKANLTDTVREFAKAASEDIADGDALYTTSLDALTHDVSPQTRSDLSAAQKTALTALHAYGKWLDTNASSFHEGGFSVGKDQYNFFLRRVLLLPFDSDEVASIGRLDLPRDRALAIWEENRDRFVPGPTVKQPTFASTADFLAYFERSMTQITTFLKTHQIVDVPSYIGPFHIVPLPKALQAVNTGGFMNPPGMFDKDPEGFYFVPEYDPKNTLFFAQQARESVLPLLGHEGIPGHFMQFSIAFHNPDYIRHVHSDSVFAEGWALFGEEMLMRTGLYDNNPSARKQVIQLMRYRATRIGVDVGLATGTFTLPQAIDYFQKTAGIDKATAYGESTRAAMGPGQLIDYLVGKTQIEALAGLVHDREGSAFTLRLFNDRLLSYGTVPLSTIRYEWLGDDSWLRPALDPIEPQQF